MNTYAFVLKKRSIPYDLYMVKELEIYAAACMHFLKETPTLSIFSLPTQPVAAGVQP